MLSGPGACCAIAALYVAALYLLGSGPRQEPAVVRRRMMAVALTCSLSWLPLWAALRSGQGGSRGGGAPEQRLLLPLLGLRREGALPALLLPLALMAALCAGPLLAWAAHPGAVTPAAITAALRPAAAPGARLHTLRDLVVAPLAEEWAFRACMVPLLWLQGWGHAHIVLVTPLFFGAAHLHHLRELTAVQRMPLATAATMVAFQFAYTTLFGFFATHVFLATGHAAAAAAVHAFCNAMGLPDFGGMAAQRHGRWLVAATLAGVVAFAALTPLLLRPALFTNELYSAG